MAREGYVKQVWEDGVSPVNAERLNEMERGIELGVNLAWNALDNAGGSGGGGMVVNVTIAGAPSDEENGSMTFNVTLDKTMDEITDAADAGQFVWAKISGEGIGILPLTQYVPGFMAGFYAIAPSSVTDFPMRYILIIKEDTAQLNIKEVDV